MKKIFLFLAMAGMAAFTTGCSDDDRPDNDTIAEVIETPPLDFTAANQFSYVVDLAEPTFDSDVVLVYRLANINGFDVWQQIPRTIYFADGSEIDYDFNFRATDVELNIFDDGIADLNALPQYTQNQIFRIVRVPGYLTYNVDTNDYDAVISSLRAEGNGEVNFKTIK